MDGSRSGSFTQSSIPDGYDRFMLAQLFEPWAADLITCASVQPGCSVLDVASGLGPVARLAAAAAGPGGRVVSSDISAAMLALASARPHGPGVDLGCRAPARPVRADDRGTAGNKPGRAVPGGVRSQQFQHRRCR